MGFLARLFGRGSADASEQAAAPASVAVGRASPAFEAALARAFALQIAAFAADHADEVFYGFALDCNAETGDILLCANTEESLLQTAKISARHRRDATLADCCEALRWSPGDWTYQGFNLATPDWERQLEAALDELDDAAAPMGAERYMRCVCRALIRAEAAGAFALLSRTEDFRIVCMDHDEDLATGDARLAAVRAR